MDDKLVVRIWGEKTNSRHLRTRTVTNAKHHMEYPRQLHFAPWRQSGGPGHDSRLKRWLASCRPCRLHPVKYYLFLISSNFALVNLCGNNVNIHVFLLSLRQMCKFLICTSDKRKTKNGLFQDQLVKMSCFFSLLFHFQAFYFHSEDKSWSALIHPSYRSDRCAHIELFYLSKHSSSTVKIVVILVG